MAKHKYLGTYFELRYRSIDNIVQAVKEVGPSALMFKVDISRACRHLKIDPGDLDLLGLCHNKYFIDGSLPFGFRHGSSFFQRCSDAIRYIMASQGYTKLYNYIDDLVYIGPPDDIYNAYNYLIDLLEQLGLEISKEKLVLSPPLLYILAFRWTLFKRPYLYPKINWSKYTMNVEVGLVKGPVPKDNCNLY